MGDPGKGERVRRDLLGDDWVDRALSRAEGTVADSFQSSVNDHLFGSVWSRPGLDLRSRLLIVLTVLASRGQAAELRNYIHVALKQGLTPEELREVFLQLTAYTGYPVGQGAFAVLLDVLEERGDA